MKFVRKGKFKAVAREAGHKIVIWKRRGEWLVYIDGLNVAGASSFELCEELCQILPTANWNASVALRAANRID